MQLLKGATRPIVHDVEYAHGLAALAFIDYFSLFAEDTPLGLIQAMRPDVLVQGSLWL
jgi:D-beta-D-heptose 7-phosphate kinase/D-beta-D-heptose 1-phosphate adenosyltransferase